MQPQWYYQTSYLPHVAAQCRRAFAGSGGQTWPVPIDAGWSPSLTGLIRWRDRCGVHATVQPNRSCPTVASNRGVMSTVSRAALKRWCKNASITSPGSRSISPSSTILSRMALSAAIAWRQACVARSPQVVLRQAGAVAWIAPLNASRLLPCHEPTLCDASRHSPRSNILVGVCVEHSEQFDGSGSLGGD